MISFKHGDKFYIHQVQDTAQFHIMESKKAQKRAVAKAKRERRELMLEARALLKNSAMTEMKGDTEAAQRLRVQAANRQAAAALVRAPTPGAEPEITKPTAGRTEVELLEALEAVSLDLRRLITNARLSRSPIVFVTIGGSTKRYNAFID
jgi:sortase (surface protein transpeptidase)